MQFWVLGLVVAVGKALSPLARMSIVVMRRQNRHLREAEQLEKQKQCDYARMVFIKKGWIAEEAMCPDFTLPDYRTRRAISGFREMWDFYEKHCLPMPTPPPPALSVLVALLTSVFVCFFFCKL
jgi:hypothetical protein